MECLRGSTNELYCLLQGKIMSSFKTHCIDSGNEKQLIFLKNISPASWEHIMLDGFYDLAENDDNWDLGIAVRGVSLAA